MRAIDLVQVEEFLFPALTTFKGDETLGRTLDLSRDGLRLELDHAIPLRSRVRLHLALGERLLRLDGWVRSARVTGPRTAEMCVEFLGVTPEQRATLDEFLRARGP